MNGKITVSNGQTIMNGTYNIDTFNNEITALLDTSEEGKKT